MVETGPSIPTCAASDEPTRCTASMIASTGSTVQTVALISDSHCTAAGACHSNGSGWVMVKCSSTSTLATQLA
ncbi:hypothetical protein D3C73_1534000 [compost metagenome]